MSMARSAEGKRRRVALAASPGGHIDLLVSLASAIEECDRTWVLPEGARLQALADAGECATPVRLFGRSPRRLLGNIRDAIASLRRVRPEVVVTSGAGVVVPYCLLARLLGARLIYMETMARVTSGSRTGRALSRVAETTLVQWPESLAVYPGARVCSPPLLDGRRDEAAAPAAARAGTFVALGTHWQPFGRLMRMVEEAVAAGILPSPVVAQVGAFDYPSERVQTVPSLAPDRLAELMRRSEVVVCHGGAGIIATTIRAGRRPLVLARRQKFGEHVDDHQQEIVAKLASLELLVAVGDHITAADVAAGSVDVSDRLPLPGKPMREVLAGVLGEL